MTIRDYYCFGKSSLTLEGQMVNRTRPRTAIHRKHVPWRTYDSILRKTCVHVDAWLYQMPDDELYFVVLITAGGWVDRPISRTVLHARPDGLYPVTEPHELETRGLQSHVDSPWAKRYAPWLRQFHPMLRDAVRAPIPGFTGHRSIYLHYVYTSPKVNDPLDGISNLYAVTGRGVLYPDFDTKPGGKHVSAWSAKERSQLRTLDKLLKPLIHKID